jgi:hypothetical protein
MSSFVVRGPARGLLYQGPSVDAALATLQRDVRVCRCEHQGPTDAKLYRDGVQVVTGYGADGTMVVAPERSRAPLPPSEMPRKWPKH